MLVMRDGENDLTSIPLISFVSPYPLLCVFVDLRNEAQK